MTAIVTVLGTFRSVSTSNAITIQGLFEAAKPVFIAKASFVYPSNYDFQQLEGYLDQIRSSEERCSAIEFIASLLAHETYPLPAAVSLTTHMRNLWKAQKSPYDAVWEAIASFFMATEINQGDRLEALREVHVALSKCILELNPLLKPRLYSLLIMPPLTISAPEDQLRQFLHEVISCYFNEQDALLWFELVYHESALNVANEAFFDFLLDRPLSTDFFCAFFKTHCEHLKDAKLALFAKNQAKRPFPSHLVPFLIRELISRLGKTALFIRYEQLQKIQGEDLSTLFKIALCIEDNIANCQLIKIDDQTLFIDAKATTKVPIDPTLNPQPVRKAENFQLRTTEFCDFLQGIRGSCQIVAIHASTVFYEPSDGYLPTTVEFDRNLQLQIAEDLLTALAFLHEHGIIHGNIDTCTVMYRKLADGSIKAMFCDYEKSFLLKEDSAQKNAILTSGYGTRHAMAPELYCTNPDANELAKADVFALGTLLYRIFYGALPWDELFENLVFEDNVQANSFVKSKLEQKLNSLQESFLHKRDPYITLVDDMLHTIAQERPTSKMALTRLQSCRVSAL